MERVVKGKVHLEDKAITQVFENIFFIEKALILSSI